MNAVARLMLPGRSLLLPQFSDMCHYNHFVIPFRVISEDYPSEDYDISKFKTQ